jgi:hypothetical protein
MFRAPIALAAGSIAAVSIGAAYAQTPGNQAALNGVYRITWTTKQLIAAGAPSDSASGATLTFTLRSGKFKFQINEEPGLRCTGAYSIYTFKGAKRFSITMNNPSTCPEINATFVATWTRPGGNLRFHVVSNRGEAGDEVLFGGKNWKKIG